jgi:hypothetical protein
MNRPISIISEESASNEEIGFILDAIEPVLRPFPGPHIIIACIAIALMTMHPEINATQLQEGVRSVSNSIVLFLDTINGGKLDKMSIN